MTSPLTDLDGTPRADRFAAGPLADRRSQGSGEVARPRKHWAGSERKLEPGAAARTEAGVTIVAGTPTPRLRPGAAGRRACLVIAVLALLGGCDPTPLSTSSAEDTSNNNTGGTCHPLFQDCPPAHVCMREANGFECVSNWVDETGDDSSWEGASVGEPCDASDPCGAGLDCVVEPILETCADQFGCCTAYCDLGESDPCVAWGLTCRPYFKGDVPSGYEDLGMCLL